MQLFKDVSGYVPIVSARFRWEGAFFGVPIAVRIVFCGVGRSVVVNVNVFCRAGFFQVKVRAGVVPFIMWPSRALGVMNYLIGSPASPFYPVGVCAPVRDSRVGASFA